MARIDLPLQPVAPAGLAPSYVAANVDGHMFPNAGDVVLHVRNGGAGPVDVTVVTPASVDGLAVTDLVVQVPAGGERFIGRFRPAVYNQPGGADAGKVYVNYSGVTSVTVAALQV